MHGTKYLTLNFVSPSELGSCKCIADHRRRCETCGFRSIRAGMCLSSSFHDNTFDSKSWMVPYLTSPSFYGLVDGYDDKEEHLCGNSSKRISTYRVASPVSKVHD